MDKKYEVSLDNFRESALGRILVSILRIIDGWAHLALAMVLILSGIVIGHYLLAIGEEASKDFRLPYFVVVLTYCYWALRILLLRYFSEFTRIEKEKKDEEEKRSISGGIYEWTKKGRR